MPTADFRIVELSDAVAPQPVPFLDRAGSLGLPGGTAPQPLTGWDWYTGAQQTNFAWGLTGYGWDQGSWYGNPEWGIARLADVIPWRKGYGDPTFTRAGTVTRTNEDGGTDTVAANEAPFDWLVGPNGASRYAYRADSAAALLLYPTDRNLRRRQGGITLWVRPTWAGTPSEGTDRIILESGDWKLWKPSGSTELRFQVPIEDSAALYTVSFDISAWTALSWHHIGVSWARVAGRVRLWTDGALRDTEVTVARYADYGEWLGVGQGESAGEQAEAMIVDLRLYPLELTATLMTALYAIQA